MRTSLWLDRPRSPYPPLVGESSYDVCVVGGGITGLLTALHLAHAGRSVVLLEARRLGAGTTGRSTAKVSLLQGTRLSRIASRNPPGTLRRYVEANLEGQAWLRRFCQDHGVPHEVRPAWTYATTRLGEVRARAELAACRRAGLPVEWVDDVDLPFETRGGVRLDDQFQVHPGDLLEELTDQLLAAGGTVHEGTRVTDVRREGDEVVVSRRSMTVRARHVVLGTGMPILDRGGFFARLVAQRSYAAAFRSTWQAPGMYLSADASTRSIRSVPEGDEELLLVGGNGHTTGRGQDEAQRLDDLLSWAREQLPVEDLTHAWSAQDHSTTTGLPYVGPLLPGEDRILVATGYEKWGFTNAAAAALLLTKHVYDDAPAWGEALRSWSPREMTGLPAAAVFNGEVAVHMARGWACRLREATDERAPVCTHVGGVLRWNDAEQSWDCPLHGSRFAPDGGVLEGPATKPLDLDQA
jgi:glycine/D-amino acid oxidase-like deaminating enzyme